MKKLTLIRHAKSSWDDQSLADIDRPLKKRGVRDAREMSRHLQEQEVFPDLILSSPAKRAFQTASIFLETFEGKDIDVQRNNGLYFEGAKEMISIIRNIKDAYSSVFLFSHMPDIAGLFSDLSGNFTYEYPTCAVGHLVFEVDEWQQVGIGKGKSQFFLYPKMMPWHSSSR